MKLVILDRDGVINHDSDNYIKSPDEWMPIAGSLEAIARLNAAGYKVAVASNQSGIARNFYDIDMLNKMHDKMHQLLAQVNAHVDLIEFCPHGPKDQCTCRKPLPGMLYNIAKKLDYDLKNVPFIGDTLGDISAAKAAGAKPILVLTGKGERTVKLLDPKDNIPIYQDLAKAVDALFI